jgi:P27 family predicted phage terminase small subunit
MPGPPRKPTALKALEGFPGHQKKNPAEPKPAVKLPEPPDHLSDKAKDLWHRIGPKFAAMGVMAEVDELAFAMLCESYAAWADLIRRARKGRPIEKVHGQPVPNPYLVRADREAEKVRRLLAEFGGSPAARARLTVQNPSGPADELESFLKLAQ